MTQTYPIPIHSMTDQITNSSTVIYTYSEASEKALKDMVNEIFKVSGIDKTCDDVFTLVVGMDDSYDYKSYLNDLDEDELPEGFENWGDMDCNSKSDAVSKFTKAVFSGAEPKPEWMDKAEEAEFDYYRRSTTLYITPKAPEYAALAKKVSQFLYSTHHDATRDG